MTIAKIRLENARALAAQAGGDARFAEKLEMSASQANQLIGKTPVKNIGHNIARRIEQAFGKEPGWLDVRHVEFETEPVGVKLVAEAANDSYVNAEDVTELVALFGQSTTKGRELILESARLAPKLFVGRQQGTSSD